MEKTVVVIGAGPAGIMAASKASSNGNKVILIEKNIKNHQKNMLTLESSLLILELNALNLQKQKLRWKE